LSARGVFERSRLRPLPLVLVTPKAAAASSRRERLSARSGATNIPKAAANAAAFVVLSARDVLFERWRRVWAVAACLSGRGCGRSLWSASPRVNRGGLETSESKADIIRSVIW